MIAAASSGSCRAVRALAPIALVVLASVAAPEPGSGIATAAEQRTAPAPAAAPVRTAKERLSGKAADEQRVNNCKVPPELRGSKPRPDDCASTAGHKR